jgi:hypothetical protein
VADLGAVVRELEAAGFTAREALAERAARELTADELAALAGRLDDPRPGVRLGVIEVLWRAGHRASVPRLARHARERGGDDRVFAIRALAQLARPGDDLPDVAAWLASREPFVVAQAQALATALAAGSTSPAGESLGALARRLHGASSDGERIALVAALEARGREVLAAAARALVPRTNADVAALLCRALLRQGVPDPAALIPALDEARGRLGGSPLACAALDDLLVELFALGPLLARAASLEPRVVEALIARALARAPEEVAAHAPAVVDAARDRPAFLPLAAHVAASAGEAARELCEAPLAALRRGEVVAEAASVGWILARAARPGEPLPRHLRAALERAGAFDALAALCGALATEEAAAALVALLRHPLPAARAAARAALDAWRSPWVTVDGDRVSARYEDARGQPLAREELVLDLRGAPRRADELDQPGCLCCAPRRVLVRRRREGLLCPSSGEGHLHDGGQLGLERDDPFGRCRVCHSPRRRVREGRRVVCVECGAGRADPVDEAPPAAPGAPPPPPADRDTLPTPPRAEELAELAPHIRAAIAANVFLDARLGDRRWSGSGIVVARDGGHVAILTNRHVIESDEGGHLCAVRALAVSGEVFRVTAVWRAARGVDLALLQGELTRPDEVAVIPLGGGAATVGAPAFAIGNPLRLAWSYTAGTISAIRRWTTSEGLPVQIIQTDVSTGPGSSGGGLFHGDGRLLGVISFGRQAEFGDSAHFAYSVDAIRAALEREGVRWRGKAIGG